jgi:hypothetical protein
VTDYYGKISALSIGVNLVIASGFYMRGSIHSNDLEIANKLADELPGLVKQTGTYTYSMLKGK